MFLGDNDVTSIRRPQFPILLLRLLPLVMLLMSIMVVEGKEETVLVSALALFCQQPSCPCVAMMTMLLLLFLPHFHFDSSSTIPFNVW